MSTSYDLIHSIGVTRMAVGIGATIAAFMNPIAGQRGWILQPLAAGSTFELYPPAIGSSFPNLFFGTTQPQSVLAGFSAQGFWVGGASNAIDRIQINGPAAFYIGNSSGSTVLVQVMYLKGQGY